MTGLAGLFTGRSPWLLLLWPAVAVVFWFMVQFWWDYKEKPDRNESKALWALFFRCAFVYVPAAFCWTLVLSGPALER